MHILIVTPLYPPDIVSTASYVKECATRLSSVHQVVILTYGHIPECIPKVRIIAVEKSEPLIIRLIKFTSALIREAKHADVVLVENGPSTELPLCISRLIGITHTILHLNDESALSQSLALPKLRALLRIATTCANQILVHEDSRATKMYATVTPLPRPCHRPEILPFTDFPQTSYDAYEDSWKTHIAQLNSIFKTYA